MRRVMSVIAAFGLLLATVFFAGSGSAQAAPTYPPGECSTLSISATTAHIGDTLHISGVNFNPGDSLDIVIHSNPVVIKHLTVDGTGAFGFDWVVPNLSDGNHIITVSGSTNEVCPIDPLEILIGGVQPTEPGNANTGVKIASMVGIAALLLVGGTAISVFGRRRRASGSHTS